MSHEVDERVGELLRQAEAARSCYVPTGDDADRVRRALSRRVARGEVVSPRKGLFAREQTWSSLALGEQTVYLAHGLQQMHPTWVFCGPTAAVLYGVDVSHDLLGRIHLATTQEGYGSNKQGTTRHAVLSEGARIEVVNGVRVTPPEQTVFDCLRWAEFSRGLGVADSALRIGIVSRKSLERHIAEAPPGVHGRQAAAVTLSWANPLSESGGESIARARMIQLGYVCPELQVEVPRIIEGGKPFRADFCWIRADGLVILGELDGTCKYVLEQLMGGRTIGEVLSDEHARESRFTMYDVSIVRFPFGLVDDPRLFSQLLDAYGVPRRGSDLALPDGTRMIPDWESLRRV